MPATRSPEPLFGQFIEFIGDLQSPIVGFGLSPGRAMGQMIKGRDDLGSLIQINKLFPFVNKIAHPRGSEENAMLRLFQIRIQLLPGDLLNIFGRQPAVSWIGIIITFLYKTKGSVYLYLCDADRCICPKKMAS